ncbi:MAG: Hsp33 family molecular chaperone HslO [Methylococcales bacterium]|nr:Hsp33 family molecular chaperone HslO [Methylococcales bacterium]
MTGQDSLHRFIFEDLGIRGEWVKLTSSWQAAKQHQQGPAIAQHQLGQALVAAVMLSATIKFKGAIILQAQGGGGLKAVVAQSTHDQKIRGLIRSDDVVSSGSLEAMFGQGRLVLTIEPDNAQPYQGIVPLQGNNLSTALQSYFEQSEQLNTRLWLFANDNHAVGLLLQELPAQTTDQDAWGRITMLADTVSEQEMMGVDCETLLYRLFNEENVRLFEADPVEFQCTCGRLKIANTLRTLGREELEGILLERGQIDVICEFCGGQYSFDKIDVEALLAQENSISPSATKH